MIPPVMVLAEISDKVPSIGGMLFIALIIAGVCFGLATSHRVAAWMLLFLTLPIGVLLSYVALDDTLVSGPFRDDVWRELGWPWVLTRAIAPLLPALCVAGVLLVKQSSKAPTANEHLNSGSQSRLPDSPRTCA